MVDAVRLELLDDLTRELRQECQVVGGVDHQRFSLKTGELFEIGHRADRSPECSQALERDLCFKSFADGARGLSMPDNVGKVRGRMVECSHLNARVVRRGEKCVAGTQAGPEDTELGIALSLQPVKAAANV